MKRFCAVLLILICAFAALWAATDYASSVRLDMRSSTAKQAVTVKMFIDGDTTHFFVPESVSATGVLKARYLAVNTPESTGRVEEYGKKASAFTREKLTNAQSIIIESDDSNWNLDSTGGRYLVWVWYRNSENEEYRNLNIELLQNGLAIASSSANNRYGTVCMAAINQAREQKLNVYSGQKDPDFYYGDAIELTLHGLRTDISLYEGKKVAFEGVVTMNDGSSVYVEEFDPESGMYNGISVYYGYNLSATGLDIISVGNRCRIVGTLQYYEAGGVWQISGLNYKMMKPKDPGNIQKISSGHQGAFVDTEPSVFFSKVTLTDEDGQSKQFDYAYLAMDTTITMDGLYVKSVSTTSDPDSSNYGAMTLHCVAGGYEIQVRTAVLTENRQLVTSDAYLGHTITVRGLVGLYNGSYQIKVLTQKDITIEK